MEPAADGPCFGRLPGTHVRLDAVGSHGREGRGLRPGSGTDGTPCRRPPSLLRCVGVPRLAGTGLAGTTHSVHGTRRWVCGPRACRWSQRDGGRTDRGAKHRRALPHSSHRVPGTPAILAFPTMRTYACTFRSPIQASRPRDGPATAPPNRPGHRKSGKPPSARSPCRSRRNPRRPPSPTT